MANRTVKDAHSIHGTNPQYLVEKIIRTRIYESKYWKEECFGLTGEWERAGPQSAALWPSSPHKAPVGLAPWDKTGGESVIQKNLSAYYVPILVLRFGHTDDRALS